MKVLSRHILRGSVFIAPVILFIACVGWMRSGLRWRHRFGVIREGVLLRGPLPNAPELNELDRHYHVKTIINLLGGNERRERPECKAEMEFASRRGIRLIRMPVDIPRLHQIKGFLDIVKQPENRPIFMHCEQGTVRTGLLVAVYRIENDGWPNQKALEEMISYGFEPDESDHRELVDFVLGYHRLAPRPSVPQLCEDAEDQGCRPQPPP